MSKPVIDYYLTMNSPWSYMGAGQLADIAATYDCKVNVYPTKFMDVFSQTGGMPLEMRAPARKTYRQVELARWIDFLKLPINIQPKYFPTDDTLAAHAVIAAQENGLDALALSQELGRAQWELEQDFAHMGTVAAACGRAGIEVSALGDLEQYGEQFEENTKQAIERGVFGYPCYLVDGEMFWGQDRLDFVKRKLAV